MNTLIKLHNMKIKNKNGKFKIQLLRKLLKFRNTSKYKNKKTNMEREYKISYPSMDFGTSFPFIQYLTCFNYGIKKFQ